MKTLEAFLIAFAVKLLFLVVSLTMDTFVHSFTNLFNFSTNNFEHKTHITRLKLIFALSLVIYFQEPNIHLAKYQPCTDKCYFI